MSRFLTAYLAQDRLHALAGGATLPAHTQGTALDTTLPETAYLFKHVLTQQVAYESLSPGTRYSCSSNCDKQRHFHWLAGKSAARRFANDSALAHLSRVLELTPAQDLESRFEVLLERERVYAVIAARQAQVADLEVLASIAQQSGSVSKQISVAEAYISYFFRAGDYNNLDKKARETLKL